MYQFIGHDERIAVGDSRYEAGIGMVSAVEKERGGVGAPIFLVEERQEDLKIGIFNLTGSQKTGRRRGERHRGGDRVGEKLLLKRRVGRQAHIIVSRIVGDGEGRHSGDLPIVALMVQLL